jgi:hypothetical protein
MYMPVIVIVVEPVFCTYALSPFDAERLTATTWNSSGDVIEDTLPVVAVRYPLNHMYSSTAATTVITINSIAATIGSIPLFAFLFLLTIHDTECLHLNKLSI